MDEGQEISREVRELIRGLEKSMTPDELKLSVAYRIALWHLNKGLTRRSGAQETK